MAFIPNTQRDLSLESISGRRSSARVKPPTFFSQVTGGLSNTLIFGERPPSDLDEGFGPWLGGQGAWPTSTYTNGNRSLFPTAGASLANLLTAWDGRSDLGYQRGARGNRCPTHHWSFHSGGAVFAKADGSVLLLPYATDRKLLAEQLPSIETLDSRHVAFSSMTFISPISPKVRRWRKERGQAKSDCGLVVRHEWLTVKNGLLVSACLKRCTFSQAFLGGIRVGQKTTLASANWINGNAIKHPEHASELELALDGRLQAIDS